MRQDFQACLQPAGTAMLAVGGGSKIFVMFLQPVEASKQLLADVVIPLSVGELICCIADRLLEGAVHCLYCVISQFIH